MIAKQFTQPLLIVALVSGTAFASFKYLESSIEQRIRESITNERLIQNQTVRRNIDESIRNAPTTVDTALEWLRLRQERSN
jgi:hypothetical protein